MGEKIRVLDCYDERDEAKKIVQWIDDDENANFKFVSLENLFKQSDIISINVSQDAPLKLISKKANFRNC